MPSYRAGNGIPSRAKIFTVALLWLAIGYSVIFLATGPAIKVILVLIAIGVTAHVLKIKTLRA